MILAKNEVIALPLHFLAVVIYRCQIEKGLTCFLCVCVVFISSVLLLMSASPPERNEDDTSDTTGSLGYTHSFPTRINTVLREGTLIMKIHLILEISLATVIGMGRVILTGCTINM